MNRKNYLFLLLFGTLSFLIIQAAPAAAQVGNATTNIISNNTVGNAPTTVLNNSSQDATVKLSNPLGTVDSPQILIGNVINAVLGIVGSLALLMFVFGGLTWMTSSGSQEKIKKGKDIIIWSALGLAVIFLSYALTRFILSTVVK